MKPVGPITLTFAALFLLSACGQPSETKEAEAQVAAQVETAAQAPTIIGMRVDDFQLLDHEERNFPFERTVMFEGLEDFPNVLADAAALRTAYLEELKQFTHELRRGCLGDRVDFVELDTSKPLDVALSAYLASREARRS